MIATLAIHFSGISQNDCDSTACNNYAAMGTFEIIADNQVKESQQTNSQFMYSCEMLCAIESARRINETNTIVWENYTILIYPKELQNGKNE